MEKKKNKINKIIMVMFLIVIVILLILTVYKLNKRHEDKLYDVLYSEIRYAANQCFLKKDCESNIFLKELYEKKYLNLMYDPITKEELSKDTKIIINDQKIEIVM